MLPKKPPFDVTKLRAKLREGLRGQREAAEQRAAEERWAACAEAVKTDRAAVYAWLEENARHGAQIEFEAACQALDEADAEKLRSGS